MVELKLKGLKSYRKDLFRHGKTVRDLRRLGRDLSHLKEFKKLGFSLFNCNQRDIRQICLISNTINYPFVSSEELKALQYNLARSVGDEFCVKMVVRYYREIKPDTIYHFTISKK